MMFIHKIQPGFWVSDDAGCWAEAVPRLQKHLVASTGLKTHLVAASFSRLCATQKNKF